MNPNVPEPPPFVLRPGQKDYTHDPRPEILNCVVVCDGEILLLRRNSKMRTYPGLWSCVTGYLDDEKPPLEKAKEELLEETGIGPERILSLREAPVIEIEDLNLGKTWVTHPVLAEVNSKDIILDWEAEDSHWVKPQEVKNYEIVPGFDRVVRAFFPS